MEQNNEPQVSQEAQLLHFVMQLDLSERFVDSMLQQIDAFFAYMETDEYEYDPDSLSFEEFKQRYDVSNGPTVEPPFKSSNAANLPNEHSAVRSAKFPCEFFRARLIPVLDGFRESLSVVPTIDALTLHRKEVVLRRFDELLQKVEQLNAINKQDAAQIAESGIASSESEEDEVDA